jgi:hypothetical protein
MAPENLKPSACEPAGAVPGQALPAPAGAAGGTGFELRGLFGYVVARLSASAAALAEAEAQAVARLTLPEYRLLAMLSARGPMGVVELQHTEHRKFKRPLQARQALVNPTPPLDPGPAHPSIA